MELPRENKNIPDKRKINAKTLRWESNCSKKSKNASVAGVTLENKNSRNQALRGVEYKREEWLYCLL